MHGLVGHKALFIERPPTSNQVAALPRKLPYLQAVAGAVLAHGLVRHSALYSNRQSVICPQSCRTCRPLQEPSWWTGWCDTKPDAEGSLCASAQSSAASSSWHAD